MATVTQLDQQDRFKDFDAAIEELKPVRMRVKGRDYILPPDVEAGPVLDAIKQGALEDPEKAIELLEFMMGKNNLDQMFEDKVGLRQFSEITRWLAREYDIVGDAEGNPQKG